MSAQRHGPARYGYAIIAYVRDNPGQTSVTIANAMQYGLHEVETVLGFASQGRNDIGQPALHGRCICRKGDRWYYQPPPIEDIRALLEKQWQATLRRAARKNPVDHRPVKPKVKACAH